jgi:hypothetical protein
MLAMLGSFIALGGFALGWWMIQGTERWVAKQAVRVRGRS